MVPLKLYFKDGNAKVELALAKVESNKTVARPLPSATPNETWLGPLATAKSSADRALRSVEGSDRNLYRGTMAAVK